MYNLVSIHVLMCLLDAREQGRALSSTEVASELGLSRTTVWRYLRDLRDEGIVFQHDRKWSIHADCALVRKMASLNVGFNQRMGFTNG